MPMLSLFIRLQLDVSESIEDKLYKKLDSMYLQFKKEYKKTKKQTKTNIT